MPLIRIFFGVKNNQSNLVLIKKTALFAVFCVLVSCCSTFLISAHQNVM
jgi:hypothetical protein